MYFCPRYFVLFWEPATRKTQQDQSYPIPLSGQDFFLYFFLGGGLAWFLRRNEAELSRRQQSVKGTL